MTLLEEVRDHLGSLVGAMAYALTLARREEGRLTIELDAVEAEDFGSRYTKALAVKARLDQALASGSEGVARPAVDGGVREKVLAYIGEHEPRCYDTTEGLARRTAFREIRELIALLPPPLEEDAGRGVEGEGTLANALTMTGCYNEDDLIDKANVGQSLITQIACLVETPGPFHGWAPADDPAEIVFDLANALARSKATRSPSPAVSVPPGWRLVPEQLTDEMFLAGWSRPGGGVSTRSDWQTIWNAMLSASPGQRTRSEDQEGIPVVADATSQPRPADTGPRTQHSDGKEWRLCTLQTQPLWSPSGAWRCR